MDLVDFYDKFHKKIIIQKRVIGVKNFTYREVISILGTILNNRKVFKILDYGCGVGTIDFYLAEKGYSVIGIDISSKAIIDANKSAKKMKLNNRLQFYNLDKGLKKITNNKFDVVLCIEVIEHVKEDKKLANFLSEKLKKEGILILSTPSKNAPLYKLGLTKEFDQRVGHLRRYTPEGITKIVENSGLKVEMTLKTEGIIRNSLFIFPFLSFLLRFVRGPISDIVTFLDNLTVPLFGESDIFVIARKK